MVLWGPLRAQEGGPGRLGLTTPHTGLGRGGGDEGRWGGNALGGEPGWLLKTCFQGNVTRSDPAQDSALETEASGQGLHGAAISVAVYTRDGHGFFRPPSTLWKAKESPLNLPFQTACF